MAEIIDLALALVAAARRPFQLEPTRVELVLRTAARSRERTRRPHLRAVEHAGKEVRRELIRRVVAEMLQVGL